MRTSGFRALAGLAGAVALHLAAGAAFAQQQLDLPRPSPNAWVSQMVGVTKISITYSRPGVKGRKIWGGLVPYGEVWRTGANENTTISFSTPVKVEGHELPAGTYGLQTIPTADDWTIIFSKDANEWGAFSYKQADDALRIQAKPQPAELRERMAFDFDDVTDTSAKVVLHWEKLKVPFTVEVDTAKLLVSKANADARSQLQAAYWCIQNNTCLDDASRWVDASLAQQESFSNLRAKALLLAKKNDTKGAVTYGDKALAAAKTAKQPPNPQQVKDLEGMVADWKEGKYAEGKKRGGEGLSRHRAAPLRQPGHQLHHLLQAGDGLEAQQLLPAVPAGADADRVHPRAPGHLQIVGGVADHHRIRGVHAQLVQDVEEHLRMGLRERFVGRAGGMEQAAEARLLQGVVQSPAALAGGDRQEVSGVRQLAQHLLHSREQKRRVAIGGGPMLPVALEDAAEESLVASRADDLNRLPQAEADGAADGHLGQLPQRQLTDGALGAGHDGADGVHQRPVPVEDQEAEGRGVRRHGGEVQTERPVGA
jgi:hypothetical protein